MKVDINDLMSTGQAAKRVGVSVWSIIDWCKRHNIGVNVGGHWIVLKQRLEGHLSERNRRRNPSHPTYGRFTNLFRIRPGSWIMSKLKRDTQCRD